MCGQHWRKGEVHRLDMLTVPSADVYAFVLCGVLAKSVHEEVDMALYKWFLLPERFVAEGIG
jgi:hypothetical protein